MIPRTPSLLACALLPLLGGCETGPPPSSAFQDVLVGKDEQQLPELVNGDEHLGLTLASDGGDVLLAVEWWRTPPPGWLNPNTGTSPPPFEPATSNLQATSGPPSSEVLVMNWGSGARVDAWAGDSMRNLALVNEGRDMNLGRIGELSRYRVSAAT